MPKGSKILMADDDKMLIDMYKERLELAGYQVTVCRNGEEALSKVREVRPELIMLDIMMPKLNGYEALASIKSDPTTKDIPVIMLSALMRDFNREKAVEAGADDYLIKSEAMPADVITKIEQVLQKYPKPGINQGNAPAASTPPNIYSPTTQIPTQAPGSTQAQAVIQNGGPMNFTPVAPSTNPVAPPPATPVKESTPANVTQPDKIIFTPVAPQEVTPKPTPTPQAVSPTPPTPPLPVTPLTTPTQPPVQYEKKSSLSIALIIIVIILLVTLINDLTIYYFLIMRK